MSLLRLRHPLVLKRRGWTVVPVDDGVIGFDDAGVDSRVYGHTRRGFPVIYIPKVDYLIRRDGRAIRPKKGNRAGLGGRRDRRLYVDGFIIPKKEDRR